VSHDKLGMYAHFFSRHDRNQELTTFPESRRSSSHKSISTMAFEQQFEKVRVQDGFLAALDQSGGSTPKALELYGIDKNSYYSDEEMYDIVHAMRSRIITSPVFNGDRILGAILFEDTIHRKICGLPTSRYLWEEKRIVPFLKVDKGLAPEEKGVQLMKPMPELESLLKTAKHAGIFGTKMRSVILQANPVGIANIVEQQFQIAKKIIAAGLVPILEPEVDIHASNKAQIELLLKQSILDHMYKLQQGEVIMLKLTLPEIPDLYTDLIKHPKCLRVVALSGGYSREHANSILNKQHRMIASFSRALTEGLEFQMADDEFNEKLDESIGSIFEASRT
jgi:fructose-bisphosphate aldolase, class I